VRVGIFGGTFDPPHVGHLLAASDAIEALGLDEVRFVPNATQPLKSRDTDGAGPADRLAMVRALCGEDPRLVVDPSEVERGGLSYMVDTVRGLRERFPGAALFLLLGEDAAATLPEWREAALLPDLAEIVVLTRETPAPGVALAWRRIPTRRIDVSSTEIRARVRAGFPITGFVPAAVAELIRDRGLYAKGLE
jgi:nicotinate-nucleotide adenylyltransferase